MQTDSQREKRENKQMFCPKVLLTFFRRFFSMTKAKLVDQGKVFKSVYMLFLFIKWTGPNVFSLFFSFFYFP